MFERLVLCEYAVADLPRQRERVYELGVRHAVRHAHLSIFSVGTRLHSTCLPPLAAVHHDEPAR